MKLPIVAGIVLLTASAIANPLPDVLPKAVEVSDNPLASVAETLEARNKHWTCPSSRKHEYHALMDGKDCRYNWSGKCHKHCVDQAGAQGCKAGEVSSIIVPGWCSALWNSVCGCCCKLK